MKLGYVSREAAERDYHVGFDGDRKIDASATARLREEHESTDAQAAE